MKLLFSSFFCAVSFIALVCGVSSAAEECPQRDKVLFCYFSSWAVYREEFGYFNATTIDPELCTHLVYSFAGLDIYFGIASLDTWNDFDINGFAAFNALKERNPCLKTLLAIGGWNQGSKRYSVMAESQDMRDSFVDSVMRFLVTYEFDGLDFDWEYPTERGGIPEDRENFGVLLKQLKERFAKWGMLLTIAVPMSIETARNGYDMDVIRDYVDYVLVMGYDYTMVGSEVTGLNSPYGPVVETLEFWTGQIPSSKVVFGVPAYGRSFTLLDPARNGLGAPTDGPGVPGTWTLEAGFLSYYELSQKVRSPSYTKVSVGTPSWNYYAYSGTDWFTYETEDSYLRKTDYALSNNLGGMMVWSIDADDFDALFSNGRTFPVVRTINERLYGLA